MLALPLAGHGRAAARAFHLVAGHAALVRDLVTAAWADTVAAGAQAEATHAATSAATSHAAATSAHRAGAISSRHFSHLLTQKPFRAGAPSVAPVLRHEAPQQRFCPLSCRRPHYKSMFCARAILALAKLGAPRAYRLPRLSCPRAAPLHLSLVGQLHYPSVQIDKALGVIGRR